MTTDTQKLTPRECALLRAASERLDRMVPLLADVSVHHECITSIVTTAKWMRDEASDSPEEVADYYQAESQRQLLALARHVVGGQLATIPEAGKSDDVVGRLRDALTRLTERYLTGDADIDPGSAGGIRHAVVTIEKAVPEVGVSS